MSLRDAEWECVPLARLTIPISSPDDPVVDLGTVVLPASLSITGTVMGPDGHPAPHGHVAFDRVDAPSRPLEAGGRFQLDGLEPGSYQLTAYVHNPDGSNELAAEVDDVPAGSTDVVIHVAGGGNLIVKLHPKGQPDVPLEVQNVTLCWESG